MANELFVNNTDGARLCCGEKNQVKILAVLKRGIAEPVLLNKGALVQLVPRPTHKGGEDKILDFFGREGVCLGELVLLHGPLRLELFSGLVVEVGRPAHNDIGLRVYGARIHGFKHGEAVDIVRIEHTDVIARGVVEAVVARSTRSAVFLVDYINARILRSRFGENVWGGVGGAVVHADELKVYERLIEDGAECLLQAVLSVINGEDD